MDVLTTVSVSAIATRNIIAEMKARGWLESGLKTFLAAYLINFVMTFFFSIADALAAGQQVDKLFVQATLATVVGALYNDFRKGLVENKQN